MSRDPFLPRRAWFRTAAGTLGVFRDGEWHTLGPLLGDAALDARARLADGTLHGPGFDRLCERLTSATRLEAAPVLDVPVAAGKILCLGKNYRAHAAEFGSESPGEPMFFNKLPEALLAPGGDVRLPDGAGRVDHEGELCVVIGATGSRVSTGEAAAMIAGWTLLDDVTARHLQGEDRKKRFPWLRSKSFDTFAPLGPWVVPFADLFDGDVPRDATPDLVLETVVSGETRQSSRTGLMVHRVAPTLSYLSRHTTLRAGDLVATGTPEGVSELHAGDRVDVRCERVGVLTHGVVAPGETA